MDNYVILRCMGSVVNFSLQSREQRAPYPGDFLDSNRQNLLYSCHGSESQKSLVFAELTSELLHLLIPDQIYYEKRVSYPWKKFTIQCASRRLLLVVADC